VIETSDPPAFFCTSQPFAYTTLEAKSKTKITAAPFFMTLCLLFLLLWIPFLFSYGTAGILWYSFRPCRFCMVILLSKDWRIGMSMPEPAIKNIEKSAHHNKEEN